MKKILTLLFCLGAVLIFVVSRGGAGDITPADAVLAMAGEPQPITQTATPTPEPRPTETVILPTLIMPPPATIIAPQYSPQPLTYQNRLGNLITYATNRHLRAALPGANVTTGRHNAADINRLYSAIQAAQAIYDTATYEDETQAAMDELHHAIDAFKYAIIDPDNQYRPFLSKIARGEDVPEKRHLRASWIATVLNIDWPSVEARGTTPAHVDMQKAELRTRFNEIAALGFNAVIFQISPTGDAFFNSEISPWSAWLTGETNFTGQLLDSYGVAFDPLEYAISLARAQNIEFHAWFNPYRITHTLGQYTRGPGIALSSTGQTVSSLAQIREEWEQIPGNAFYLFGSYVKIGEDRYVVDPAAPGVRDWIVRRVMEVVRNYDIDAVHFDDYFYPSGYYIGDTFARYNSSEFNLISGATFPDTAAGRADFRRENTEMMIRDVSAAIRAEAPWVKFGVSPGGVWKSASEGNTGLDGGGYNAGTGSASTTTWSNYHSSFADTRNWVIENLIDYLTPQIYWEWSHNLAPYGIIAEWWGRLFQDFGPSGHLRNSHGEYTNAQLFIGVGLYRMEGSPAHKWNNANQGEGTRTLLRQEAYNIANPNIMGSMYFTQNQMRYGRENHMHEAMQELRATMWRYPALIPTMPHLGGIAPAVPVNIVHDGSTITWEDAEISESPLAATRYFVIYRSHTEGFNINDPSKIAAVIPAVPGQVGYAWSPADGTFEGYYFAVTAVNRLHDESQPGQALRR
ncbi:MAG: family 10 glycosylhydrolase [Defluviitaleaceae bacterium]|nr:family 10 glycosylhydrolase [Defluviitaleaceae bacterium]